jgi:hypothetical protein
VVRLLLRVAGLLATALLAAAEDTSAQPPADAPGLGPYHLGWRSPQCGSCHGLPVAGHAASESWACAACHGSNGACSPETGARQHAASDPCGACHQGRHGFAEDAQCVSCHFAAAGRADCSAGRGGKTSGLTQGCLGWPEAEFTPNNRTSVRTGLGTGALAVDFELRDPDGVAYTLSGLLATKPVLLVFGALT